MAKGGTLMEAVMLVRDELDRLNERSKKIAAKSPEDGARLMNEISKLVRKAEEDTAPQAPANDSSPSGSSHAA